MEMCENRAKAEQREWKRIGNKTALHQKFVVTFNIRPQSSGYFMKFNFNVHFFLSVFFCHSCPFGLFAQFPCNKCTPYTWHLCPYVQCVYVFNFTNVSIFNFSSHFHSWRHIIMSFIGITIARLSMDISMWQTCIDLLLNWLKAIRID